jgi:hypothetical protein
MGYDLNQTRFTFYVRYHPGPPGGPGYARIHADEKCARWKGLRATVDEQTALGDTVHGAAKECRRDLMRDHGDVRICSRCIT